MNDVAIRVGDQVAVRLPAYRSPFRARVKELHIFWDAFSDYFAHPDGEEAEITHQQIAAAPTKFQVVVRDDDHRTHFVPVTSIRPI